MKAWKAIYTEPLSPCAPSLYMDPLKKAHDLAYQSAQGSLEKLLSQYPEIRQQVESNLKQHGVPVLSAAYDARWREDIAQDVANLLYQELPQHLLEITIRPEDPEGHHWSVEYHVLTHDENGNLVRASEKQRKAQP